MFIGELLILRHTYDNRKSLNTVALKKVNKITYILCPLCNDRVDKLIYRYHLENEREVLERIRQQNPQWSEHDGLCSRCVDYYQTELVMQQRILPEIGPHFPVKSADDFVILPTGLRLDAVPRYTGKGVTICFIDSGFYLHPDLVACKNRIKTIVDITNPSSIYQGETAPASWHGTMTSVVCAGDGYLSNGLYKGIASDAEVVLLKVQDDKGSITTASIVSALNWILQNHQQYGIRVVNISLASDDSISFRESEVDSLAERLIAEGIVVVAAIGNEVPGVIKAPANSPNVISVGGINDENKLGSPHMLYHSSWGKTVDSFMKPELLAPAIWIAAPILPFTREQEQATLLHHLLALPDDQIYLKAQAAHDILALDSNFMRSADAASIKEALRMQLLGCKYISPHYMHVDGTSFAAPIVTGVIAQLLEIDPKLSPRRIRELLFSTSARIPGLPAERQGFGVIQPRKACLQILKQPTFGHSYVSPDINSNQKKISFYTQNYCAGKVSLTGSFNDWEVDVLLLEAGRDGIWKIEIPMLAPGKYSYKFVVDEKLWIEDVNNPFREPDGFSGFNSILNIEN